VKGELAPALMRITVPTAGVAAGAGLATAVGVVGTDALTGATADSGFTQQVVFDDWQPATKNAADTIMAAATERENRRMFFFMD